MSPRSKRRRTGDRCHGTGCGQPDCGDCHRDEDAAAAAAASDAEAVADVADATARQHDPPPSSPPPPPQPTAPSPGLAAMIAALEEKALRDLLLQSAASSQEIQRSIKDAYHRQVARPQPPPLLPQPLLTSHLMMQQAAAAKAVRAAAAASAASSPTTASPTTTRLPVTAAAAVPNTTTTLSSHQHQTTMTRPVTNFDHYSKSAWHALNDRQLLSLSGSRQYTLAGDVYGDVCDCVNAIDDMTRADSPLGTKQNALETLREIARAVILAGDTVGHEVRRELQGDSHISDVMVRVAESMTPEERLRTGRRRAGGGEEGETLIGKLEWVRDEAEALCLKDSEGFGRVLELLRSGFASAAGAGGGSAAATPVVDLTH
ncbi:hypothetical protein KVR01_008022 [Diaporthe batatas]|uniref:uncharacterized protein n=1 Tax=Diaporthe batatas TaxID=748121 RepID=UPI001D05A75F|nr:uncharacterized protein KVR01_008022 [Diaporthe batatas]KAG8162257.1 hypothetical protein KVR01_008022 [Diaporthe batatas]